jgi:hypothetical protein
MVPEQVQWPKASSSMVQHGHKASSLMMQTSAGCAVCELFWSKGQSMFFNGAGTSALARGLFLNGSAWA